MDGARGSRNETVDALRGFAAAAVCLFHFAGDTNRLGHTSIVGSFSVYGYLGVEVFFVISGFIVPYAMARSTYTLAQWPRFMAKRLIRLEPPYLVSIALVMGLWTIGSYVPGFMGSTFILDPVQVALHVGYLNAFVGMPWLNPVYWTLAIEFQFYLLIGLLFPAIIGGGSTGRLLIVAALAALPFAFPLSSGWIVSEYLPIFSAGLLTFLLAQQLIPVPAYWAAMLALGSFLLMRSGLPTALATILPAVLIAVVRLPRIAPVAWLGAISYSLYLLHVPIGGRVMNLAERLDANAAVATAAVAVSFAVSITAAYVLYILIERPSKAMAAGISYAIEPSGEPQR